jgi:hypothetical protein
MTSSYRRGRGVTADWRNWPFGGVRTGHIPTRIVQKALHEREKHQPLGCSQP